MGEEVCGELEVVYVGDGVGWALPVGFYAEGVWGDGPLLVGAGKGRGKLTHYEIILSLGIFPIHGIVVLLVWSAVISMVVDNQRPLLS